MPAPKEAATAGLHSSLVRHTGFLITRLGMSTQRRFAERLAAIDLTPRMYGALHVLEAEGPMTQHTLGRCVGIDPSSMVATVDELETRGLVERRRHPSDRRAHALHLTAQGKRILARGRELAERSREELLAPLDEAERAQLHELLLRLTVPATDQKAP